MIATKTPNVAYSKSGYKSNNEFSKMDYLNSRNSYDGADNDSIRRAIDSLNEQSNKDTNYETQNEIAGRSKSGAGHHTSDKTNVHPSKAKRNSKTARSKWREFKVSSDFNSKQALKKVKQFNEVYNHHNL